MANELQKHVEGSLLHFLGKYKGQIEAILPRQLTPQRVLKLIIGAINRNPKLAQCTPMSVVNAVLHAATMGLEIRPGMAYLVPYKNKWGKLECNLLIDYRGKIDLALRSDRVTDVDAEIVFGKETFRIIRDERGKRVEHEPMLYRKGEGGEMLPLAEADRGVPIGAYAVAYLRDAPPKCVFMPKIDIEKIRDRSRAKDDGPWVTDPLEMWKKTVIHRICKLLPQTPEMARAQEVDDGQEMDIPLDAIIDVQPEDETAGPLLPQSAEAAQDVAEQKLTGMVAQTKARANREARDAREERMEATAEQAKTVNLRGQQAESPEQSQPSRVADVPKPAPVAEPAEAVGKQEPPPPNQTTPTTQPGSGERGTAVHGQGPGETSAAVGGTTVKSPSAPTPGPQRGITLEQRKRFTRLEMDLTTAEFKRVLGLEGFTSIDEIPTPAVADGVLVALGEALRDDRVLFAEGPEAGPGPYDEAPTGRRTYGRRR